jgi:hypothetical protein
MRALRPSYLVVAQQFVMSENREAKHYSFFSTVLLAARCWVVKICDSLKYNGNFHTSAVPNMKLPIQLSSIDHSGVTAVSLTACTEEEYKRQN